MLCAVLYLLLLIRDHQEQLGLRPSLMCIRKFRQFISL
jgi:hypothetical protein